MTPAEQKEMLEIAQAKRKADICIIILAVFMASWAGEIMLKGGYDAPAAHIQLWRGISWLPLIYGVVLLVTFRYSWSNLIGAIVTIASSWYLISAPVIGGQ